MDLKVRAHSIELDQSTRDYAYDKIGRAVEKFLGRGGGRVDVEVTELSRGHGAPCTRVKVHVAIPHTKGETVHVEAGDAREAIDLCADKIGRAVKRHKKRRRDLARSGSHPPVAPPPVLDDEIDEASA